jgi:oligoendopeptidase F
MPNTYRSLRAALSLGLAVAASPLRAAEWDLTLLYPDREAWLEAREEVLQRIGGLEAYRDTLGEGGERLQALLDETAAIRRTLGRMGVYAGGSADVDMRDAAANELTQLQRDLWVRLSRATSFIRPEMLQLGADRISTYLARTPGLEPYRFQLQEVLRFAPHTLGEEAERLLAGVGAFAGASANTYGMLTNADIPWPVVTLSTGEEVTLNAAGYVKHRAAPSREDRRLVFETFWGTYQTYERTFGTTFGAMVQKDLFFARSRHYPDSLTQALAGENLPRAVFDTLVAEVNHGLPVLHRHLRLRQRLLGLEDSQYHDIYPDVVAADRTFPLAEGQRLTYDSAAPLGEEYRALLRVALDGPWLHAYPAPGKRSGAYMTGAAYDVHPYVFMNYQDDYDSVTTLAHEWGHGLHTLLANRSQSYPTARYSIFVAEIAAILPEVLLLEHMLAEAASDDERLYYLGSALDGMRGTFFRQTMFAEFEAAAHARAAAGGTLTGASLTRLYADIIRRYHGHDEGVMTIADAYTREWAYIPHFYNSFYVYQYATSQAAANLFADRILAGEPGAREAYLDLLRAGGSDHPYELVRRAGVDLASPEPYRATLARMSRLMDQMETILDRQGR